MFLLYKPEGAAEETRYEFRPARVPFSRARIAEKLYSKAAGERRTWEQFVADATMGSIAARKVAYWVCLTDTHPNARFEDVPDFCAGELTLEYSKQELRQMRGALEGADMLEAEKAAQLAGVNAAIAEATAGSDEPDPEPEPELAEPEPDVEPGKDNPNDEPSTS